MKKKIISMAAASSVAFNIVWVLGYGRILARLLPH